MSRRLMLLPVATALAATALVGVSSASSPREPQVLNYFGLVEKFQPFGFTAWPPHVGDRMIFSGSWYEWAGRKRGKRVGQAEFLVTVTSKRGGWGTGTAFLPGGRIFFEGWDEFVPSGTDVYAVVGGSGRYAGRRGTLTLRPLGGPPRFPQALTIELQS